MFLKVDEARSIGAEYRRRQSGTYTRTADSMLVEKAANFSGRNTYDVFLSHSYSDAEVILGVMRFIESQGKSVYVDWIVDKNLDRSSVNEKTADLLRLRMRASQSLIYAASEGATKSKWMPWELGFFDGHKPGSVSVLPLVQNNDSEWKGQEYLGLYPVVTRLEQGGAARPFVVRSDRSAMTLTEFGRSANYIYRDVAGRAQL